MKLLEKILSFFLSFISKKKELLTTSNTEGSTENSKQMEAPIKRIPPFKTETEAKERYGQILGNTWENESKWMVIYQTPDWFQECVVNSATGRPCNKIYMNKDMVDPFTAALSLVKDRGLEKELKTFDGCWMVRDVRGIPGKTSTHSYGLAIDLNAKENPLGGPVKFSNEFIKCFTDVGFTAGAYFKRVDGQHFSFAWE